MARLAINANGDPARFAGFGLPVVADRVPDWPGPLAGLHAAMVEAAANHPGITHVAMAAADTPFLPRDLVDRLADALSAEPGSRIAIARSGGGLQPVFALVPMDLADRLEADLRAGEARRVRFWLRSVACVEVEFPGGTPDPFFNVNSPEDLILAETLARVP